MLCFKMEVATPGSTLTKNLKIQTNMHLDSNSWLIKAIPKRLNMLDHPSSAAKMQTLLAAL
jgi:hypothetical protein